MPVAAERGTLIEAERSVQSDLGFSRQRRREVFDAPGAIGNRDIGTYRLENTTAEDHALGREMHLSRDQRRRDTGQRPGKRREGGRDRDRLFGAAAERRVEVNLARRERCLKIRLVGEVQPARCFKDERTLRSTIGNLRVVDLDVGGRQLELSAGSKIHPGRSWCLAISRGYALERRGAFVLCRGRPRKMRYPIGRQGDRVTGRASRYLERDGIHP